MKRITSILTAIAVTLSVTYSFADQVSETSKQSYNSGTIKVSDVMRMKQGQKIWLQGSIVRAIGKDHYILKDSTGEIKIKASKTLLKGREVPSEQIVNIYGEVGQNNFISRKRNIPPEIKVKKIETVQENQSQPDDDRSVSVDSNRK